VNEARLPYFSRGTGSAFKALRENQGAARRTRFMSIPCSCCKEDTTHYVGKCIHCGTISERIPDAPRKKILFGRGEAA
jgi:hypothetical protein